MGWRAGWMSATPAPPGLGLTLNRSGPAQFATGMPPALHEDGPRARTDRADDREPAAVDEIRRRGAARSPTSNRAPQDPWGRTLLAIASQFVFVERDRAVIVQATKFLAPFLVDGDLVATFVKLEHVRADALKRHWLPRHPGVGCDETRQKADAD
jgi:hypothetical protein